MKSTGIYFFETMVLLIRIVKVKSVLHPLVDRNTTYLHKPLNLITTSSISNKNITFVTEFLCKIDTFLIDILSPFINKIKLLTTQSLFINDTKPSLIRFKASLTKPSNILYYILTINHS
jgi:hypothetical protein